MSEENRQRQEILHQQRVDTAVQEMTGFVILFMLMAVLEVCGFEINVVVRATKKCVRNAWFLLMCENIYMFVKDVTCFEFSRNGSRDQGLYYAG